MVLKREEFAVAMSAVGFSRREAADDEMLLDIFDDATYEKSLEATLNLESFARWLSGTKEKKRTVESLRLGDAPRFDDEPPVDEVAWSIDSLRFEMQRELLH